MRFFSPLQVIDAASLDSAGRPLPPYRQMAPARRTCRRVFRLRLGALSRPPRPGNRRPRRRSAPDLRPPGRWLCGRLAITGATDGAASRAITSSSRKSTPRSSVPLPHGPFVLIGTVLTHLFGGSAGREGTAIQMGASLADTVRRILDLAPPTAVSCSWPASAAASPRLRHAGRRLCLRHGGAGRRSRPL
ncbi:MAG: chloride channel protein [Chloroflexi bacterium]|nr:chloride channel protein [Chloroflexota bacterium]